MRHRILWGVVLGVAGFIGNLLAVEVLPNAHMLLGPFFVLLAAVMLGPIGGAVAALIGSIPTLWLWGHPYGLLNFTLEAIAVGLLSRRFQPVMADVLYWLVSPLYFFLTYHLAAGLSPSITVVMAVKQAVNALLFALLIQSVLLLPPLRKRVAHLLPPPVLDISLLSAFTSLLTLCAIIPLLVVGGAEGRARYQVELDRKSSEHLRLAESIRDELERAVEHAAHATRQLAEVLAAEATQQGLPEQRELERRLAELVRYSPEVPAAYIGTPAGRAIAFFPTHNVSGAPLSGTDFSDRPYVKQLATSAEPLVSGVFQGRGGVNGPLIIIAAPIRSNGKYLGYVLSGLSISRFRDYMRRAAAAPTRALVVDRDANVISDSAVTALDQVETIRGSALEETLRSTPLGRGQTYVARPHPLWALRGSSLRHFVALSLPSVSWTVIVEEPTDQLQRRLERSYLALLLWIGIALGLLMVLAKSLARAFIIPVERVSEAANRLAVGDRRARAEDVAQYAPLELRELARRFDGMADQLSKQLEKVEAAGREKDAFLTVAAHELRTPLTALKAQVQLLNRKQGTDLDDGRFSKLNRQIDRLTRLINQLMDASQLVSGRLPLVPTQLDVAELVRRVAESVVASSAQHQLAFDCEPTQGFYDEARLEQVVHNLLSNAIKYSPEGGTVEVSVKPSGSGGAFIQVADRGIGLGAVEKVNLFERFARGSTQQLQGISGFGVGLYISREIVRLHGGTIRLAPRDGGGAVATVELPATPLARATSPQDGAHVG